MYVKFRLEVRVGSLLKSLKCKKENCERRLKCKASNVIVGETNIRINENNWLLTVCLSLSQLTHLFFFSLGVRS